jgi:hypothetical protein
MSFDDFRHLELSEVRVAERGVPVGTPFRFIPPRVSQVRVKHEAVPPVVGPDQRLDPPPEPMDEPGNEELLVRPMLAEGLADRRDDFPPVLAEAVAHGQLGCGRFERRMLEPGVQTIHVIRHQGLAF